MSTFTLGDRVTFSHGSGQLTGEIVEFHPIRGSDEVTPPVSNRDAVKARITVPAREEGGDPVMYTRSVALLKRA